MKKQAFTLLFGILSIQAIQCQQYLNHQLRLEPVWARVADALGEPGSVESVEFSPDGKHLVSGTKYDNSVILWRTSDGTELWRNYAEQEIERVGWSSDGKYVAAASEDYLVTVYEASTGKIHKKLPHQAGIDGLTWSHKGSLLVSGEEGKGMPDGSTQGFIRVFDMETGEEIQKMDFGRTVNELFFSEDDAYLLAVGHGNIRVYRVSDWSLVQTLNPGYYVTFTSGNFSPDAQYVIAVGQAESGARGNVYLWEWKSGELVKVFNHTGKKVESITWHPNGQYVAHAGHDPYIYIYRLADILSFGNDDIPVAHKVWASDHAEYIDFNRDGSFLASAHQNGLIKLWVWMGEDPALNSKRHRWVKETQKDAENKR
jgi:WD40 repeat protein